MHDGVPSLADGVAARLVSARNTSSGGPMIGDQQLANDDVLVMVGRANSKELHTFRFPASDFADDANVELAAVSRTFDMLREDHNKS
jgi:hypothetical protein